MSWLRFQCICSKAMTVKSESNPLILVHKSEGFCAALHLFQLPILLYFTLSTAIFFVKYLAKLDCSSLLLSIFVKTKSQWIAIRNKITCGYSCHSNQIAWGNCWYQCKCEFSWHLQRVHVGYIPCSLCGSFRVLFGNLFLPSKNVSCFWECFVLLQNPFWICAA